MNHSVVSLDKSIVIDKIEILDNCYHISCHVRGKYVTCPKCNEKTKSIHSFHDRRIQDLPIQGKTTFVDVSVRLMHCKACNIIFTEPLTFAESTSHMTNRLKDKILKVSVVTSSLNAVKILESDGIKIKKSAICNLIKKNNINQN